MIVYLAAGSGIAPGLFPENLMKDAPVLFTFALDAYEDGRGRRRLRKFLKTKKRLLKRKARHESR